MIMSLRLRLALSYLAVLVLGMGVAAPLAWLAVEQQYLESNRVNLLTQAELAAAALRGVPDNAPVPGDAPPYSQTTNTLAGVHTRVIDARGAIVIDAQVAAVPVAGAEALPPLVDDAGRVTPGELLARQEVLEALAGKPATAVRELALPGRPRVLYAAAPVVNAEGAVTRIVYIASPLPATGWDALPERTRLQLAAAGLLALALAGAAGWWHAVTLARPLDRLVTAAGAVAGGDLAQRVPEDGSIADLRALGRAFNRMTAGLRRSDQAKSAFVADVTHELRTPLTVIKGTIETLQDGAIDDLGARDRFLGSMAGETDRLIRLVNDLLVLARADAGALRLQPAPVDLGALARARVEHLSGLAAQQGVALHSEVAAPAPVTADAARLTQVLDNLLDNAIRYSRSGDRVTVTVRPQDGGAACSVADTGPGIPAQHLPFIFDRFYRAEASRSRSLGGSGLGLAITRALILVHNGRIEAASVEGQGTTVTFWIPGWRGKA